LPLTHSCLAFSFLAFLLIIQTLLVVGHDRRRCRLQLAFFTYKALGFTLDLFLSLFPVSSLSLPCFYQSFLELGFNSHSIFSSCNLWPKWRVFDVFVSMGSCFSARIKAESPPRNGMFTSTHILFSMIFVLSVCQR